MENLSEQLATAIFAFAVQDVTKDRDVIAGAEIRLQHIPLDIIEASADAELLCDSFSRWNHPCPIERGHPHPRRFLDESNAPST